MPTSSQGLTFSGLPTGLTNVKVKTTAADPSASNNKIDASTLDLAEGANRVYVDAPLVDAGSGSVDGVTTTVTVSYLSATPPVAGDTFSITTPLGTVSCKCTEAEIEYAVGDLVKGTATYVSIPVEQ